MKKRTDDEITAALLEFGGSVPKAANALGLSSSALYRRVNGSEAVQTALAEHRRAMLEAAATRLETAANEAIAQLQRVMSAKDTAASVRVSAADAILRHCMRYVDAVEVRQRIDALERRIGEWERSKN